MKKSLKFLLVGALSVSVLAACGTKEEKKPAEKPPETVTKEEPKKHESYAKYEKQLAEVKKNIAKYEDVKVAIDEGFRPEGPFVPMMGYHFVKKAELDPAVPNTLLYVLDENGKFKLVAAEWSAVGDTERPHLFDGIEWELSVPAQAIYVDGTTIPVEKPDDAPKTNPQTGAAFATWQPNIWGIHMYTHVENPDGLFAQSNTEIEKYTEFAKGHVVPPIDEYLPADETPAH